MRYIFLISLMIVSCSYAQVHTFGEVSLEALTKASDSIFPGADAVYIFRDISYTYGGELKVFERIKIYTKEGFEFAKKKIGFHNIKKLQAATYNIKSDLLSKTIVPETGIFVEDVGDELTITKITFPEVRVGSILDVSYTVPYAGLRSIAVQSIIPIKTVQVVLKSSFNRNLAVTQNPLSGIELSIASDADALTYVGFDIEPLKQEKFVTNIENYRAEITIEQVGSFGVTSVKRWGDVAEIYNRAKWFGKQLKRKKYFQYDLPKILGNEIDPLKRAQRIYYHVQEYMKWDDYYSKGSEDIKKAYTNKEGSNAEINFIIIAMMRKAGLDANPFLLASLSRGYVLSPTLELFNVTICAVEIDNKTYLLDASRKTNDFGELSNEFINGNGLLVYPNNDWKKIPTSPMTIAKEVAIVNVAINPQSRTITGDFKRRIDGYLANRHRMLYIDKKEDSYWKKLKENTNNLFLDAYSTRGIKDVKEPITFESNFKIEEYIEEIAGEVYINPLFIFGVEEDEFTDLNRTYPIDFRFPYHSKYKINFTIPSGYEVKNLLDAKNLSIPDNIAFFKYDNKRFGNQIQISMEIAINKSLLGTKFYDGLKTIFTEYYKTSNSKIVLVKKGL